MAFGAVPNDGLPDQVAIQAAIDSAMAGSHEVCIPSGVWNLAKSARASLRITGGPLRFYGAGPSTILRMTGDGGRGDWYGIDLRDAHTIELRDFTIDALATFNTEEQTHLIQLAPGTHDSMLTNLVLGPMRRDDQIVGAGAGGDCVRLLGEPVAPVERITITQSQFVNCDRSGISLQRAVRHIEISHLDIVGTGDSPIDFEPTAPGPIAYITMADLFIDRSADAQGSFSIAIAGHGPDVADHIVVKDCILQGGGVSMINVANVDIVDNDIASGEKPHANITMRRRASNITIKRNVLNRREIAPAGPMISATHNNGFAPKGVRIVDNQMRQETSAPMIEVQSATDIDVSNNQMQYAGQDTSQPIMWARSVIAAVGGVTIRRNTVRGRAGALLVVAAGKQVLGKIEVTNNTADEVTATVQCAVDDKARQSRITVGPNQAGAARNLCARM